MATFSGGAITSDAGALPLEAADRAMQLSERLAAGSNGQQNAELFEHGVSTLVMQRLAGIAFGYEDLSDHVELRHDPVLAAPAGKLRAERAGCAPLADNSRLRRLELRRPEPTRYHKVSCDPTELDGLLGEVFVEAQMKVLAPIILDLDATDDPLHGHHGEQERDRVPRQPAQPILPRLSRPPLLCAALRALRPPFTGGEAAALESRRSGSDGGGDLVDRGVARPPLSACAHPAMRRLRFCPRGTDAWCKANRVDYLFGLARKRRLEAAVRAELNAASLASAKIGKARDLLGYRTTRSLDDGLSDVVAHIQAVGPRRFRYHLELEIR
ncbi:MAG: transposase, partial [Acetobacteraceae bacterium]